MYDEMKQVIVIAKYRGSIPEDMTVSQIEKLCEKKIRENIYTFKVEVEDYDDKTNNKPLFEFSGVMVGVDHYEIRIGTDEKHENMNYKSSDND